MQKRHAHVSPTLDIMAKKIFSLPEVTTAFIRDILELDVADAQIVEGSQPHSMAYEEDDLFSTAVDVRAKLHDGTEVIIEIQIRKHQNLLQVAFLELDKYNKDENLTDAGRQWLEFFGNLPFTKSPSQAVTHADSLLDSSSWTKEEKTMIDERIRIQENYDMTMETAIDEAREEGLEQGLTQGLEQGLEQGVAQGRKQLIREMVSRGMTPDLISEMTGLSIEEIETLLS